MAEYFTGSRNGSLKNTAIPDFASGQINVQKPHKSNRR